MEGRYGGCAQRSRGKRRGRIEDEGQDYEGKREAGGGGGSEKTTSSADKKEE
jgi:hypothetical protein